jgi:hypothetical protein
MNSPPLLFSYILTNPPPPISGVVSTGLIFAFSSFGYELRNEIAERSKMADSRGKQKS